MALSTYSELKTGIANWLNRTDLTDEIADDFIKLTEADFNAKLRIRAMEQIDSITIDSETETVPQDLLQLDHFIFYLAQLNILWNTLHQLICLKQEEDLEVVDLEPIQ